VRYGWRTGTDEYYELLGKLGAAFTREYTGLNNPSIRRIYLPTVVFVKDGKILGAHTATVDSQKDPYTELTKKQKDELKRIYINYMEQVANNLCSLSESC
jgi:hypothetical protein